MSTEQDKQAIVKAELKALRKHMTVEEYNEYLRVHAGSIQYEKALKKAKQAQ
jgi:hypothetical protein